LPAGYEEFAAELLKVYKLQIKVNGGAAIAVDTYKNDKNEYFIHLLNYDNDNPANITVELPAYCRVTELYRPDSFGFVNMETGENFVKITKFHTYMVIKYLARN
jgi:hypothetical protein